MSWKFINRNKRETTRKLEQQQFAMGRNIFFFYVHRFGLLTFHSLLIRLSVCVTVCLPVCSLIEKRNSFLAFFESSSTKNLFYKKKSSKFNEQKKVVKKRVLRFFFPSHFWSLFYFLLDVLKQIFILTIVLSLRGGPLWTLCDGAVWQQSGNREFVLIHSKDCWPRKQKMVMRMKHDF
jgi:hypothetical protein